MVMVMILLDTDYSSDSTARVAGQAPYRGECLILVCVCVCGTDHWCVCVGLITALSVAKFLH